MDKHEMFMRKALEEARLAEEEGEIPVGAVVVCKGRVIARAHNQTERLNDVRRCLPSRPRLLYWEENI